VTERYFGNFSAQKPERNIRFKLRGLFLEKIKLMGLVIHDS
jgi:hypothetical protein